MSSTRRIGPAVAALTLAMGLSCTAFAQDGNVPSDGLTFSGQVRTLPPDSIVVERRQPIPFVPFEMVDPATGAPIAPDEVITFPADGGESKQMPARDYFRELNAIEAGLCELGYSLRQDWKSVVIQRSVEDPSARNGLRRIRSATDSNKPFRLRTAAELEDATREQPAPGPDVTAVRTDLLGRVPTIIKRIEPANPNAIEVDPNRPDSAAARAARTIVVPPKTPKVKVTWGEEYPFELGDPTLFAAGVNARLDIAGSEDRMKVDGWAKAGITVFSMPAELARFDAHLVAPKKGDMSGNISVNVVALGNVYEKTLTGASVKVSEPGVTYGIDIPLANFIVTLGPVPVRVSAGAQGSIGFRYFAGLNPASAVAEFAPIVRSNLYVKAGAEYYVAGVGIDTRLTLVNYDLSMYSELRLWMQTPEGASKPEWGIRKNLEVSHKLQMLSGSSAVYAYVYYPTIGIPPWDRKEWRWQLFSWDGFTPVDGNLISVAEWTSLGIPLP